MNTKFFFSAIALFAITSAANAQNDMAFFQIIDQPSEIQEFIEALKEYFPW
ncbi:MAG: hypothetical protein KBT32_09490 [Bacteroidales bacterium]|nr:hypothetical protein [Candidatus Physcocola equi]